MVWVPTAMFPFCCFGGYYKVKRCHACSHFVVFRAQYSMPHGHGSQGFSQRRFSSGRPMVIAAVGRGGVGGWEYRLYRRVEHNIVV